jgi:hypothetical protein
MLARLLSLIFIAVFMALPAEARKPAQNNATHFISIQTSRNAKVKDWVAALPKGAQIYRNVHPFYLIAIKRPITPRELQTLRSHKSIRRVNEDKPINPAKRASDLCPRTATETNLEGFNRILQNVSTDCELATQCGGDNKPILGAQMAVGGDLMLEELKRIGLDDKHTKVAVLDSGFNPKLSQYMSRPPNWEFEHNGTSTTPVEGSRVHGSYVTSVYGGRGGIGLSPGSELGLYKVTVNDNGQGSAELTATIALEACKSGHKIINVSFEDIHTDYENPDIVRELEANGCMVVNSNGNSPGKGRDGVSPDDGWLRVGGIDPQTGKNHPLELGEVNAPGFDVGVLDPQDIPPSCTNTPMGKTTGTSLAAPLMGAILANVRGVLAKNPRFNRLSGPNQVKLLNRVLRASKVAGMPNGLTAVLIAERWGKDDSSMSDEPSSLQLLLRKNPPAICSKPMKNPELDQLACADRKASMNEMRAKLAAGCEPPPTRELEKMVRSLPKINQAYWTRTMSRMLPPGNAAREEVQSELAEHEPEIEQAEQVNVEQQQTESVESRMALTQSLLNMTEVPGSVVRDWSAQLLVEEGIQAEIVGIQQQRIRELQAAGTAGFEAQIQEATNIIAASRRNIECSSKWRAGADRLPQPVSPEAFHGFMSANLATAGCGRTLNLIPEPFSYLAGSAANGETYQQYRDRLTRQYADDQLDLMLGNADN